MFILLCGVAASPVHQKITSFWVGRRRYLKISCLVFGERRGVSLSWHHYPPLLWMPFPNRKRFYWTRQPSTSCCWYLNILCPVRMPWAHYHRTATLIQDKHCDMEQFNQQKAKNKEGDETETASGVAWEVSVCAEQFLGSEKQYGLRGEHCAVHLGLPERSDS